MGSATSPGTPSFFQTQQNYSVTSRGRTGRYSNGLLKLKGISFFMFIFCLFSWLLLVTRTSRSILIGRFTVKLKTEAILWRIEKALFMKEHVGQVRSASWPVSDSHNCLSYHTEKVLNKTVVPAVTVKSQNRSEIPPSIDSSLFSKLSIILH